MAKYKALLIDDNTQFTESVKGYLLSQDRFSEVDTAQDGREALKKLREKTYDVMTLAPACWARGSWPASG